MRNTAAVRLDAGSWADPVFVTPGDESIHLLDRLLSGTVAVVVLRGFLSPETQSAGLNAFNEVRALSKTSEYPNGSLTTIGPYLARHIATPEVYFEEARRIRGALPAGITRLRDEVYHVVSNALGLDSLTSAQQSEYGDYSPCVIRLHGDGVANPLHNDMIARDAKHSKLIVGSLQSQLSCIACLQECTSGVARIHYQKTWIPEHEQFKVSGNLGYNSGVVEGIPFARFKPAAGDIYIINPTYYHEISKVGGDTRVTMGFFFGHTDTASNKMIAWS